MSDGQNLSKKKNRFRNGLGPFDGTYRAEYTSTVTLVMVEIVDEKQGKIVSEITEY